jgi:hypothetical protein
LKDLRRICVQYAAENLAHVRRVALTLLQQEKNVKGGIHGKRLKARWDGQYLLE